MTKPIQIVTAKGTVSEKTVFTLKAKYSDGSIGIGQTQKTVIEILQKNVKITDKTDSKLRNYLNKLFDTKKKKATIDIDNWVEVLHKGDKIYNREDERVLTVHAEDIPVWADLQKRWTKAKVGNEVTVYISFVDNNIKFEI